MQTQSSIKTNVVYLIHFETAYETNGKRAQHYLGFASNLPRRLDQHATGHGSALMAAVEKRGIDWYCVRTWAAPSFSEGFALEKKLKLQRNHKRFCPMCRRKS